MERKRSSRRYGSRHRQKTWGQRVKDFLRQFIAFMFSNVGIIGLVVGYTILGAIVFQQIEGGVEDASGSRVVALREATARRLWRQTLRLNPLSRRRWTDAAAAELLRFQESVVAAIQEEGFDGTEASDKAARQWSFPGAFLYALTVITTIGYGNVTPKTEWGKMATILYAIVGMPLFLLYLSNIGDILAKSFKWIYARCCLCRGCACGSRRRALRRLQRRQLRLQRAQGLRLQAAAVVAEQLEMAPAHHWQSGNGVDADMGLSEGVATPAVVAAAAALAVDPEVGDEEDEDASSTESSHDDPQAVTVPITLCLAIMVGYMCGGALLFSRYESWDFLDGSYFCFISLSTIGFGDIVPGDKIYTYGQGIELSFILCSMYLMLGMALIAMCFNLMQEEVVAKIRSLVATARAICRCRRRTAAAAEGADVG